MAAGFERRVLKVADEMDSTPLQMKELFRLKKSFNYNLYMSRLPKSLVTTSQSYKFKLQRQRYKNLRVAYCVLKSKIFSFTLKNALAYVQQR
jgi:hypothetical protein